MTPYTPTDADRLIVHDLAAIGASHADIAAQLDLPLPKLEKLFKRELYQGDAAGKLQALRKLHSIALSGENLTALSFYVKARCGWRDTGTPPANSAPARQILWIGNSADGRSRPPA